ncbi:MAG TPA: hypothetical protein VES42_17385 [Pilimelia sp.]|nr:hypothetical protein [Pilimelia sp.]
MPFNWDVYVWIPRRAPEVLQAFIDRYVDAEDPGEERLAAFTRTYIDAAPADTDAAALAELVFADSDGFTLYLNSPDHHGAMITITDDGGAVLGLTLDGPDHLPAVRQRAEQMIDQLRREFSSPAGIAGAELPPPRSRREWHGEPTPLRVGTLDP